MDARDEPRSQTVEVSSMLIGFDVVDRAGERIGRIENINLARTCLVVETPRARLGRRHTYAVHASALDDVDLDTCTVTITASKDDVAGAPEFHELDDECEAAIARYYQSLR